MDRREICSGGGAKPARRFSFSWADEVEREEEAQQQQQEENQPPPPRRGGETEEQTNKANPFGAARPREVVLAEKGVDWRARERELDEASRRASAISSRSRVHGGNRHAGAASVPATPATSNRLKSSGPPVSYGSAWGGKRKCAGQDEPSSRHVRPVGDHGRRVFGQLNIGEVGEFESSRWNCSASRGSVCAEGIGPSKATIGDDEIADSAVPVPAGTETGGGGAGRRRRGGRRMGSHRAKKQQTLLL